MSKLSTILHDTRLAELPETLAGFCRDGLQELVRSNYQGKLQLGGRSVCIRDKVLSGLADNYFFSDGRLLGNFRTGDRMLFLFPVTEAREVRPEDVPFERYKPEFLTDLARVIEEAYRNRCACSSASP